MGFNFMANKRMFSLDIVDSDAFLDMPLTSQCLYFHLAMHADDEGFIGNPKRIMKMVSVQEDDMKILKAKRFVLSFESGVIVIKHWLIHNNIRMDRFNPTTYQKEKKRLYLKQNKAYTDNGNQLATTGTLKLSKVKLSEVNLIKKGSKDQEENPTPERLEALDKLKKKKEDLIEKKRIR